MLDDIKSWAVKEDIKRVADKSTGRQMCSVTVRHDPAIVELRKTCGIECINEVVRKGRLLWVGHGEIKDKDE